MLCGAEQDGAGLDKEVEEKSMAGLVGHELDIVGGAAFKGAGAHAEVNAAVVGSATGIETDNVMAQAGELRLWLSQATVMLVIRARRWG